MQEPVGRLHLEQAVKVNTPGDLTGASFTPVRCDKRDTSPLLLPQTHDPSLIMRLHQRNPNCGAFCKTSALLFKSVKVVDDKNTA